MVSYQNPHLYNGRYRALVIDDKDPIFRMRVKVRIPDLMVAEEEFVGKWAENGIWAFPANNYLGGRNLMDTKIRMEAPEAYYQGSCLIPPKGSHVWIIFEKGDVSHPFYTGSAEYGDCVALPENQIGKEYQKKWTLLKSPEGRCCIISDDPSDCRFEITGKKRLIKNPPFGDIDSVYKIDENQTVFLIDEREDHEKILLRDYTGNFMKLVQNENQETGKFYMHTNDSIEIDCGGDFYLSVTGNMHIRAQNVFITALDNIEYKAYMELKEYAQTFDRYSQVHDRTLSGNIDIVSKMAVNIQAATKLYQSSLSNIRNCVIISDVASGNIYSAAGGTNSINAGGKVLTYGKNGTAIQTKNPEFAVISNSIYYPTYAEDAEWALPDGERYQEIETIKDPILNTQVSKDSLQGFKIKHGPVPYVQEADAGVGTMSNESAVKNGNSSNGNSRSSTTSNNSSSSDSSSRSSSVIGDNSSSGSSSGSISDISSSSGPTTNNSTSDTVLQDITEDLKEEFQDQLYSYNKASSILNEQLISFTDNLRNYGYGLVAGIYISFDDSFSYDSDNWNIIKTGSMIGYNDWYERSSSKCYSDICDCLCYDVEYDSLTCSETLDKIYQDVDEDYSYLIGKFIENLRITLNNKLPRNLSDYISSTTSYQFDCFEGIISTRKKSKSIKEYLYSFVKNLCYNIIYKSVSDVLNDDYVDFQNKVSDILTRSQNIVEKDKKEYSTQFVSQLNNTIKESTNQLKSNLVSATKMTIDDNDQLISEDLITKCVAKIKSESSKIITKFTNSCEEFKENSELIDQFNNELIEKCRNILKESLMSADETSKVLDEISSEFASKTNGSLTNIDNFSISDDIFYKSFEKINSNFETLSFNILKVYDIFKTSLVLKISDRVYESVCIDVSSIINEIDAYCNNHKEDTTEFINELKQKISNLVNVVTISLCEDNLLKNSISPEEIDELLEDFREKLKLVFITKDNDSISQEINDSLNDVVVSIEKKRKYVLNNSIKVEDTKNNQFSKYNAIEYTDIPDDVGFGYKYALFLNEQYRKTIAPLTLKCGANIVAFDIITNTSLINEKTPFIDRESIESYNNIFTNLNEIDTTTKWWTNLKELVSQCSVFNIKLVITLCDFSDETNPFILNKNTKTNYTDKGWDDNIQGKFFKTVFDIISQYEVEVIYNIGRRSYTNPSDLNHNTYNMYPNCGYIRKLINYFVYTCGITSNYLSLTANDGDNLYYYSPYTEYRSYDDLVQHELTEHDISILDYVDGKVNDNADIVTYDENNIGGYAGYLMKCNKESVAIFNMDNLSENIPLGFDINDPNIMNSIFCRRSREAVRYFKTKDYFETTSSLEFDLSGEVK